MAGGYGHERAAADEVVLAHVRRLARNARRVASVCTGASVLAAAGLLDGRRATTHWFFAGGLARAHPAVTVDPDPIFVRDGSVATSAGVTSALDLTLSFVEEDHGAALARGVARSLVTYLQRPGTQAQMSVHVSAPRPADDVVRAVVDHVAGHLDDDLGAAALADRAGVSQRHLTRLFRAHLGRSPGEHVRRARTEAAAHLLATTDLPLPRVAARCGFGSTETLRTAFLRAYGTTPSAHRRAFVTSQSPAPSPATRQGVSLGEAGRGLHTERRALVELLERRGAGVGAGRAHAGADAVEQVLHARALGVELHARGRDALLEQPLAGAVERRVAARAGGDGALRRHAERLLVRRAVLVAQQVAGRLVGAREPRAHHHRRGAGGEGERDVAGVAHPAVGPDVRRRRPAPRRRTR